MTKITNLMTCYFNLLRKKKLVKTTGFNEMESIILSLLIMMMSYFFCDWNTLFTINSTVGW
jgi:hypothetical protein